MPAKIGAVIRRVRGGDLSAMAPALARDELGDIAVEASAVADTAPSDEPKPAKPGRRPKSNGSSGAGRARSRRVVKPDNDAAEG
jgi:hypothetical protein